MKRVSIFFLIFISVLFLYYPVVFTYFSQDDFFHFKVSLTDGSLRQFLDLFGFQPFTERGIAFYRPLFREALFNISYSLFELSSYPLRIFQFILLLANSFLTFYLVSRLFKNFYLSSFVSFFYAICAAQTAPLYYLAGGIQVLGATFFLLLCIIFWNNFLISKKGIFRILSFLSFLLALGSHELSSIIPILLYGLTISTLGFKKAFSFSKYFLLLFIILALLIFSEIKIIGYSSSEQQYSLVLNPKTILNSYMWYTGWALGLPEMLIDFVFPGFKLNPVLMRYWGNFYKVIFPAFFISSSLVIISLIYLLAKRNQAIVKKGWLFLMWFLISLLPVIFLPSHKSTQYLETGLPAFWTLVGLILFETYRLLKKRRFLSYFYVIVFVSSLLILSTTSIFLQRTTFWAAERGRLSEKLIKQVKQTYPSLPKGAAIYFKNDPSHPFIASEWGSSSKQAALVLNNEDALQLVYKDPTLKVYYEDTNKLPENFNFPIFEITATIY